MGYFTNYPKHVFLILGNEFCERFSYFGMTAILALFLSRGLMLSNAVSKEVYHAFGMMGSCTPLLGAILADGFIGKYRTIFSLSIVHAMGNIMMALAAVPFADGQYISAITYVGLVLVALGTGGIKPCVAAFGADQFDDTQTRQKESFFSLFYMIINIGSLASMIMTPLARSNVRCFGDDCYALAFGLPAILMVVALILFVVGTPWYTTTPPGENVVGNFLGSIFLGLKGKLSCSKNKTKRDHWLDYADSKYDKAFLEELKRVFGVLFVFTPFPVFIALFAQQGSSWMFQASQLDGDFGFFVMPPDLMPVINPILIIFLVPLMESCFYPCLNKLKIPNSQHHRMIVGMLLAATAFVLSAILQISIDKTLPTPIHEQHARFKILNAVPCDISGTVSDHHNMSVQNFSIPYYQRAHNTHLQLTDIRTANYTFVVNFDRCNRNDSIQQVQQIFAMLNQGSYNMIVHWDGIRKGQITQADQPVLEQAGRGGSMLQFFNSWRKTEQIRVETVDDEINATLLQTTDAVHVPPTRLDMKVDNYTFPLETKAGAVYTIVLHYSSLGSTINSKTISQYQDITHNSLNIFLMLPQYFLMTLSELFFMVSAQAFAYTQSMKSVLQACWLFTGTLGNLIIMVITAIGSLPNQVAELFLYAGLMYVTTLVYGLMLTSYKYVDTSANGDQVEKDGIQPADQDNGSGGIALDNLAFCVEEPQVQDTPTYDDPVTVHL